LRHVLQAAFLASLLAVHAQASAQAPTLDGRVFVGDAGEKGQPADEKGDVITFRDGQFHSSSCDQWGYGKAAYRASARGDAIDFEVETASEKDGRLVWRGTVRGDTIEGTFVHHRKGWLLNPNPDPVEHWFKGRAKS
jgi:hypothetical protein